MLHQQFIRILLEERGLTARKACKRCGLSTAGFSRMMADDYEFKPSVDTVARLIKGLKLQLDEADALYQVCGHVPPDITRHYCTRPVVADLFRRIIKMRVNDIADLRERLIR